MYKATALETVLCEVSQSFPHWMIRQTLDLLRQDHVLDVSSLLEGLYSSSFFHGLDWS